MDLISTKKVLYQGHRARRSWHVYFLLQILGSTQARTVFQSLFRKEHTTRTHSVTLRQCGAACSGGRTPARDDISVSERADLRRAFLVSRPSVCVVCAHMSSCVCLHVRMPECTQICMVRRGWELLDEAVRALLDLSSARQVLLG